MTAVSGATFSGNRCNRATGYSDPNGIPFARWGSSGGPNVVHGMGFRQGDAVLVHGQPATRGRRPAIFTRLAHPEYCSALNPQ